jgi:hypothetical protein
MSMDDGINLGIAQELAEYGSKNRHHPKRTWLLEVAEAIGLSVIAVATAWCGYSAARWDGRQAFLYAESSRLRVEAAVAATEGGQLRLLDVVTFNTWVRLREVHDDKVAGIYERRFSPEYHTAFLAWLKTDPFNNQNAPPGPVNMPEYHNANLERAAQLNKQASTAFDSGTAARQNSEQYVRCTVLLATILFLIALSQRFKAHLARVGLLVVATGMLVYVLINVAHYPKL